MSGLMDDIEAFTCLMFGHARERTVNGVRSIMLQKMMGEDDQLTTKSKLDLSLPCKDNLLPLIQRVNHRLASYKRPNQAMFSHPKSYGIGQGWEKTDEGILEPVWSRGPMLSPALIDLLEETVQEVEDNNGDEDEQELDYYIFNDD